MFALKRLAISPLIFLIFALLIYNIKPLFGTYDFIFSLSINTLIQSLSISALVVAISYFFCLFATIADDWKFITPVVFLTSMIPLIFLDISLGIVFAVASVVAFILTFASLNTKLKTYLSFEPNSLLSPSIKHLISFLILAISLSYFLSVNKTISEKSFQIPDSLIDASLKLAQPISSQTDQTETTQPQISIPQEQLDLLRKNPELLKQSGLDPKILDTLNQAGKTPTTPANLANDLIKQTIKDQIQNFIKPYIGFIPALLAVLLFFSLQFFTSLMNLLIYPLLWITFYLLEKTGFIKFTQEMRPVKKIVV